MNYSNLGKRIVAAIIDGVTVNLIAVALTMLLGPLGVLLSSVCFLAYTILMMGSSWHATLGMKALGMYIVDEHGNGLDYAKATIRTLCTFLSSAILGIGYIIALFSDYKQTLHDKIAGTYVVDGDAVQGSTAGSGYIVGVSGEKAGMAFPVTGNGLMIGRDTVACQVVMTKSAGISRLHCIISYNPQSRMYVLTDRNSSYGTFKADGTRVTPTKSVALKSGERFYLGSTSNMFEVG